jgi:2-oxoglutarate ferredoxin oxidoreductase subunit beta
LGRDYDPTDKYAAMSAIHGTNARGEVLTGIIYVEPSKTFIDMLNICDEPLGAA